MWWRRTSAALLVAWLMAVPAQGATITLFGSASTPTDDDATGNAGAGCTITPPASMQASDGVLVLIQVKQTGLSWSEITITNTGGQQWHETTDNTFQRASNSDRAYLARFDGTWDANPAWDGAVATTVTCTMIVFRTSDTSYQFDYDGVAGQFAFANFVAPTCPSPCTVTRTGITTETDGAVIIAGVTSLDDDTYVLDTSGGFANATTAAQVRNNAGTDQSMAIAYRVLATAGASGNITWTQGDVAADAGISFILALKLVQPPTFASATTVDSLIDFETSSDTTVITTTILGNATHGTIGTWGTSGGTPNNTTIETDGQMSLSAAKAFTVAGTTYDDASATRGAAYDHTQGTELPSFTYTLTTGQAIISFGFFYKTTMALEGLNSYSSMAFFASGSGEFVVWNLVAQFADQHVSRLEVNSAPGTRSGPHFDTSHTYWVTFLMDTTAGVARMQLYDPANSWKQFGFTVSMTISTADATIDYLQVFCSGGAFEAHAGLSYYDNIAIDYTNHVYPLVPGNSAAATAPPKLLLLGVGP